MHDLIAILGPRMVDAAVAAAMVSGSVALAMILTRQPSRRRALARAGVVGTLFVVPLVCLRPFPPLDLLGPVRLALEPWLAGAGADWSAVAVRAIPLVLLAAYGAGVAFGLARMALGGLGLVWILRNSRPASAEAQAIYDALPSATARPRPALRVSERATRPVLLGTIRPTILVPPDLDRPDASEALRLALLHELAHAEASDPWFGLASELASALWFWLPPLRWIGRQMRLDQEFLADRHASERLGPSSTRYASTLVEIAASRDLPARGGRPGQGAGSALLQRVLMLVRCPFIVEGRPPPWWRASLALATVLVLLLATGLTLRAKAHFGPPQPAEVRSIDIASFTIDPKEASAAPTLLPLRLPPDFELTFTVLATPEELGRTAVLGHPLSEGSLWLKKVAARRHWRVTLLRRDRTLSLGLDDDPPRPLPGRSTDEWLSARGLPAPAPRTNLRQVHLSW